MPKKRPWAGFVLAALLLIALYVFFGCPILRFTGCACPGCGMTRAVRALLRFDLPGAWHFHPLVFFMPVFAALLLLFRKNAKKQGAVLVFLAVALLAVYIARIATNAAPDVLVFRPWEGLIGRLLRFLFSR